MKIYNSKNLDYMRNVVRSYKNGLDREHYPSYEIGVIFSDGYLIVLTGNQMIEDIYNYPLNWIGEIHYDSTATGSAHIILSNLQERLDELEDDGTEF